MLFLGGETGFCSLRSKERKEKRKNKRNKEKTNKEGLGPSEVALRATSPKQQKTAKNKRKQKTIQKNKKSKEDKKNTPKWVFQLSINFFFFWWVSKISLSWQLGPKSAPEKKHYKNRGFSKAFLKTDVRHETAIFLTKKTKFRNSNYHVFAYFLLLQQQKPKQLLKPLFL